MTATKSIRETGKDYSSKFDNLDSVAHLSIAFDPKFAGLMQKAIDRNSPLSRAEVEEVFGDISWEW